MPSISVNNDQRLFVIPSSGGGFSCLGFDVVFKRLRQYASKLGLTQPDAEQVGQLVQYEQYLKAESAYIGTNPKETLFDPETPIKVQALLEAYRTQGGSVRVFYGDSKTGRDWLEEHDVLGRVSRSMGPIKVALLVPPQGDGGPAMLTACIVRMVDAATKQEVYRHPQYHQPAFKLAYVADVQYPHEVVADGKVHARFKSEVKALKWLDFIQGRRMTK